MKLPPHVARAKEPLPPLSGRGFEGPDLRRAAPLGQMLEWLAALHDDTAGYLKLFRGLLASAGLSVGLSLKDRDDPHLLVGSPCDAQVRHRSRVSHFLFRDLDRDPARRAALIDVLRSESGGIVTRLPRFQGAN